jgi:hypothetical protein
MEQRGWTTDPHDALGHGTNPIDRFLRRFGFDQHGDAMPVVRVSNLRHSEPAGRALDQADPEALLEQADAAAEPGAWHAECPRGGCEAAVFDHLGEEVEIVEVLHGPRPVS